MNTLVIRQAIYPSVYSADIFNPPRNQSSDQQTIQSINQTPYRPTDHRTNQPTRQKATRQSKSTHKPAGQSKSTHKPANQSNSRPTNQPANQRCIRLTGDDEEEDLPGNALLQRVIDRSSRDVLQVEDVDVVRLVLHQVLELRLPVADVVIDGGSIVRV